ncbi:MAG: hypothetical protein KDD45_01375 [Bdellovibrionales bacterium]|nr:hypothetical protein [Bdellovibrionales bacterium]
MATNRLGFNQFLKKASGEVHLVLDANVIIAYFFEDHRQHDIVRGFLTELDKVCEPSFYSTVTVKSEFLEFRRKQFLTEGLLTLVDEVNKGEGLWATSKAKIQSKKALLSNRKDKEVLSPEGLPMEDETEMELYPSNRFFYDSELKEIKLAFRSRDVQKEIGWLKICDKFLKEKLEADESVIDQFCTYLTTKDDEQKEVIFKGQDIEWKDATHLCASTGLGYSDAMILNIFKVSNIPYMVTLDSDLVYGVTVNAPEKTVLLPDGRLSKFKQPLKKTPYISTLPSGNS